MAKDSQNTLQKVQSQHFAKVHNLKGQLPEESMESLATNIGFVTLNCQTVSTELQQSALYRHLRYLFVPFGAEYMRDWPVKIIESYTMYCGDGDEKKTGGCAIPARNDYKKPSRGVWLNVV
ncbi:hypothetical protein RB195_006706 [Necator americanus]|uniref:Uncharacterized protein n=1 Tax=Necator americanus TaxID=51031 RepID=A0ABR1BTV1_NECAM